MMNTIDEVQVSTPTKKKGKLLPKIVGFVSTTIYILLLPVLLGSAFMSFMAFDANLPVPTTLFIIFLYFCIPISIVPGIYYTWKYYEQGRYGRSYFFAASPVLFGAVAIGIIHILFEY